MRWRSRFQRSFCLSFSLGLASSSALAQETAERPHKTPSEFPSAEIPLEALSRLGRFIKSGLRVETTERGVKVSRLRFPSGGEPRGLEIPPHLGGGFLFSQSLAVGGTGVAALYRAEEWTGELRPLARIPFPVERIVVGFDRFYVFGVVQAVAIDPSTGAFLSLDPLPPLVTVDDVAFSFPERAQVKAPLVGVLQTQDSGQTWQQVKDADGLEKASNSPGGETATSSRSFEQGSKSRAFVQVVTSGVLEKGAAYGISEGHLYRLFHDKREGFRVEQGERVTAAETTCVGVPGGQKGDDPLFVCRGPETVVYRLLVSEKNSEGKLLLLGSWPKGTRVLSGADGGVLLSHDCSGKQSERGCLVRARKREDRFLPDTFLPDTGAEVTYVLGGSEVWGVWVEAKKQRVVAAPLLGRVGRPKDLQSWKIPKENMLAEFLQQGTLLPQGSFIQEELAVWVVLQDRLMGVRLGASKEPSFGSVQRPLTRALFDGPRALLWGAAGFAKWSEDGGQIFDEISLPFRSGDAELSARQPATGEVSMGCSEVGCVLGSLIRLGYRTLPEAEASLPEALPRPPEGPGRFRFVCALSRTERPHPQSRDPAFPSFWEASAPNAPPGSAQFSVGFPADQARLYASGPAEGGWSRGASAELFFIDPWRFGPVKRTAPTPRFFASSADAQGRMGLLDRAASHQLVHLDPDGEQGAVELRSRDRVELVTFLPGEPLRSFVAPEDLGLRHLVSVVRSGGDLYGAFLLGREVLVARFVSASLEVIGKFPLGDGGTRGVRLIRTKEGHLGLSMEADDGLLIYPLSAQGELGDPLLIPEMRERPEACSPEATGFLVERELSVSPYMENQSGENLRLSGVRARFYVGHGAPCLESLTARAAEPLSVTRGGWGREAVPLSVFSTTRTELMCE